MFWTRLLCPSILLVAVVESSSVARPPLGRISHPRGIDFDAYNNKRQLAHDSSFRLSFVVDEEPIHIHLEPNFDLLHPEATVTYHSADGSKTIVPLQREDVRAYHGNVIHPDHTDRRRNEDIAGVIRSDARSSGEVLGWARITVYDFQTDSFEGTFTLRGETYHIVTKENYLRAKHPLDPPLSHHSSLIIFSDSDLLHTPSSHSHSLDSELGFSPFHPPSLTARDDIAGSGVSSNFIDHIGQTQGCPSSQMLLYLGVAADCEYVSTYGSAQNATSRILSTFNSASALYKSTLNVSLGIVELSVHDPSCPSQASSDAPFNVPCSSAELDQRLSLFSQWRGTRSTDGIGLWHLMSGCPTGQEVGIGWIATLCQATARDNGDGNGHTVSGTAVSTSGLTEWQVVSHETGHNFGAIHDCVSGCTSPQTNEGCCPLSTSSCNSNSQYIMSPTTQSGEKNFSPCSIGNICSLMTSTSQQSTNATCFVSPSSNTRPLISLKQCGNGIVEPENGEECDPGTGTNSDCCDSTTCKLKNGAKCDPLSSSCCTSSCGFAPATQVCRGSKDASGCDPEEKCPGDSSTCPKDIVANNGQGCSLPNTTTSGLSCASGRCTSVALQCQQVGGSLGLRQACPQADTSCQISCQNPNATNSCIQLNTQLVEGSSCGYAGYCTNEGKCQQGSWLEVAKAWYRKNLQIAIPVTVVAALLILTMLYCCAKSIFGRLSPARKQQRYASVHRRSLSSASAHQRLSSREGPVGNLGMNQMSQRY